MKKVFIIILILSSAVSFGQSKYNYIRYNKLFEINGTEYVVASMENKGKMRIKSKYLLFINTETGQTTQVDFPMDAIIYNVKQVKIDKLEINKIIIEARTVNLNGNKSIDWNDPLQIIILSTDGKEKKQLTDDRFFVSTWSVNNKSGTITISGYYDTNQNGRYDRKDKNAIEIYSLKTLKLEYKI